MSFDSPGVQAIATERLRQVAVEGWSPEHDDEHIHGEIAAAAAAYTMVSDPDGAGDCADEWWPWDSESWKPSVDPLRNLARAGALIAAEYDRIARQRQ
jgi:hypothetical protein